MIKMIKAKPTKSNKRKLEFVIDDLIAIKMRGIPFGATEKEIAQFFEQYQIVENAIKIGVYPSGLKTGEAVVLFKTVEEAKRAVVEKQGDTIGHRWVELIQIKYSQYISFDIM